MKRVIYRIKSNAILDLITYISCLSKLRNMYSHSLSSFSLSLSSYHVSSHLEARFGNWTTPHRYANHQVKFLHCTQAFLTLRHDIHPQTMQLNNEIAMSNPYLNTPLPQPLGIFFSGTCKDCHIGPTQLTKQAHGPDGPWERRENNSSNHPRMRV